MVAIFTPSLPWGFPFVEILSLSSIPFTIICSSLIQSLYNLISWSWKENYIQRKLDKIVLKPRITNRDYRTKWFKRLKCRKSNRGIETKFRVIGPLQLAKPSRDLRTLHTILGNNLTNARNGKSMWKISKMAKFEASIIREWDLMTVWGFKRIRRLVCKKLVDQGSPATFSTQIL